MLVINNYTSDRLNFGLALTRAQAKYSHLAIDSLVIADDVSLLKSPKPSLVGARGPTGCILVCKIVGAYMATGASLWDVKELGEAVVGALASIGVRLDHCHVPGRKVEDPIEVKASNNGQQECEVGMGIHNEPGVKEGTFAQARELIDEMLQMVITSRDGRPEGPFLQKASPISEADEAVLYVNNLGGISVPEMGAVVDEIMQQLHMCIPIRVTFLLTCFPWYREH